MRVHISPPPAKSKALERVVEALVAYGPESVTWVDHQDEAELVVLHVIGRQNRMLATAKRILERGQKYAVIQFCLRSTRDPSTEGWLPLWEDAVLVWSYYDLPALCAEDGTRVKFRFYQAPLGVNNKVFRHRNHGPRPYIIATSGLAWTTESIREACYAAERVGQPVFHLGPELFRGPQVTCKSDIDDKELAIGFNQCKFVAGLRRTEGFELPAAEGLMCGARPICFDRPHYRQWYGDWAYYIPEGTREEVINSLAELFKEEPRPVGKREWLEVADRFSWHFIVHGFWDKVWAYATL